MRHALILVGIVLFLSISTAAQGPAGVGSGSRPASTTDFGQWQLGIGYQFNRINLTGSPFDTNGLNASLVRFVGGWFGLEAQLGLGFGDSGATTVPARLTTKSVFAGGGPRLAYRNRSRVEPWIHGVVGVEHFRFTQTAGVLGNNTSVAGAAGGGMDFKLSPHTAFRAEVDWMFTNFFSMNQRHFQAVGGLALNF
jgi:hypothetical protein